MICKQEWQLATNVQASMRTVVRPGLGSSWNSAFSSGVRTYSPAFDISIGPNGSTWFNNTGLKCMPNIMRRTNNLATAVPSHPLVAPRASGPETVCLHHSLVVFLLLSCLPLQQERVYELVPEMSVPGWTFSTLNQHAVAHVWPL